ncbi:MAG TPA: hypothetical protein VGU46_01355 [Acidobacteriaceae bacterium]|nr:hypothetical protein [Acidobacteriaceae bacterium]
MPEPTVIDSATDSIPKVHDEVSVGANLEFQRKWWRFEHIVWSVFFLILLADLLGAFGRGWLAKAHRSTPDQALTVDYERIARASTPSILSLHFSPPAIRDNHIQVFLSDSIIQQLGAQRISPQPVVSAAGEGGITYTFAATRAPAIVQISLQPQFPGSHAFRIQLANEPAIQASTFVLP